MKKAMFAGLAGLTLVLSLVLVAAPLVQAETYYTYTTTTYPSYDGYQSYGYPYSSSSYGNAYGAYGYSSQSISLSKTNISLYAGQSTSVTVYGGGQLSTSGDGQNIAQGTLYGNVLNVVALYPGSTTINVCNAGTYYYGGNCASLYVTVVGTNTSYGYGSAYNPYGYNYQYPISYPYGYTPTNYYPNYYNNQLSLDDTNVTVDEGDRERIGINDANGRVYVSDNGDDDIATASIDSDELVIRGRDHGHTTVTVCDNLSCASVRVTVED